MTEEQVITSAERPISGMDWKIFMAVCHWFPANAEQVSGSLHALTSREVAWAAATLKPYGGLQKQASRDTPEGV